MVSKKKAAPKKAAPKPKPADKTLADHVRGGLVIDPKTNEFRVPDAGLSLVEVILILVVIALVIIAIAVF